MKCSQTLKILPREAPKTEPTEAPKVETIEGPKIEPTEAPKSVTAIGMMLNLWQ